MTTPRTSAAPTRSKPEWNHNLHYHPLLLEAMPDRCDKALDVGCGNGNFTRKLASRANSVVGIDRSEEMIDRARVLDARRTNVSYELGDFLTFPLLPDSFDVISALAVVHHVDQRQAFERLRDLLRPGGTLVVLGFGRDRSAKDYATSALAVPASKWLRLRNGWWEPGSPCVDPTASYAEVRALAEDVLPGLSWKRLWFYRYLLVWVKPS